MKDLTKVILNYIITLSVPRLNTYPTGHSRPIEPDLTYQDPTKLLALYKETRKPFEVSN